MNDKGQVSILNSLLVTTIRRCCAHARMVVCLAMLLAGAALFYLTQHIAIDTDTAKLISERVPWRQRDAIFDAAFPQGQDQIVVVLDAATPELAETTTTALAQRLSMQPALFKTVRRPDGGPFFDQNGLLFLSKDEVSSTMAQLIAGQPLLGSLAADPSLRGLMNSFSLALQGVDEGEAKLADLTTPLTALADTVDTVLKGGSKPLSWRQLITGKPPASRELRRFILVQPVLDFTALSPGAAASTAIRQAALDLNLTPQNNVRVRLTGPVPLEDEEFATLADGAALTSIITLIAVIALLWLGLRSIKMIAAIVVTLISGLLLTAAFGLAVIGPFNLISVAFAVLFIGLGSIFASSIASGIGKNVAVRWIFMALWLPRGWRRAAIGPRRRRHRYRLLRLCPHGLSWCIGTGSDCRYRDDHCLHPQRDASAGFAGASSPLG